MIELGPLLPIPRGKKGPPCFQEWQGKTPDELEELYPRFKNCNPGLRLDHLVQIDADNEAAIKKVAELKRSGILPPTVNYLTWRGIETPLYKARPGLKSFDIDDNGLKLQIRTGAGHYALIPDSTYQGKPYKWAKHLGPADVDVADLPEAAMQAFTLLKAFKNSSSSSRREGSNLDFQEGARDKTLYTVAKTLFKGGMPPQDAEQVIKILAKNCSPAFSEKEALRKIESAFKEDRNFAQEVREWVLLTSGNWLLMDAHRELELITRANKQAAIMAIQRLEKEGIVEKCGEKRGCYRRIERESTELDFKAADCSTIFPLTWPAPFHLERLVNLYGKNLVVVAGSSNAGKTALLLNLVKLNMDRHQINYFSSEMGPEELRLRLQKFDTPLVSDWNFKAYERAANFKDAIVPDQVNIIDFIEISDAFYKIGGELKGIFDKLTTGLAIIAIQKVQGAAVGRGGDFSMEKARLYLSMDSGQLTITKGKNWAKPGHNPNGKIFKFKLIDGCKFMAG